MSDSTVDNAALFIIISNLIVAIGAWVTARITATSEKPTDVWERALKEERNQNAILQRRLIEGTEALVLEKSKRRDVIRERDKYATYALELRTLVSRHVPRDIVLPELDANGTTPEHKKPSKETE